MTSRRIVLSISLATALSGCGAPPVVGLRMPRALSNQAGSTRVVHQVGSFKGAGGIEIFTQSWRPQGSVRGVLVIHHGLKSYSDHYAEFAERLAAQGYAVYALDMRGHGRSAGQRATLDDFDELLADLDSVVKKAREREGAVPLFILGHSVGGAVVTLYAVERRPKLAGLIVLAPAIRVDRMPFEAASTPLAATLTPNLPLLDVPNREFSRSPAVVSEMDADPLIYQPPGPVRTAAGLIDAIERIWARADTLDVPLLALHGTADNATDPRGSAELVRRARNSDHTLLLYKGLYHDLIREPEKEQVMTDVEAWMDKHLEHP